MGWTAGQLLRPFTALAAIKFDLGEDFARRVIDTALYGRIVCAAVRSRDGQEVFGRVLLTKHRDGDEERAERERTDRAARRAARWNDPPPYDSPQGEREREREEGPWAAE